MVLKHIIFGHNLSETYKKYGFGCIINYISSETLKKCSFGCIILAWLKRNYFFCNVNFHICEILPKMNKQSDSISHNETKETKNQVFCPIFHLLVCLFGLTGRWYPEIPDFGWLFRVVCVSGDCVIALGHSTYIGGLHIHKRITARN